MNLKLEMIPNRCNLCGSSSSKQLFSEKINEYGIDAYAFSARRRRNIHHFRIVRCQKCGLVRSDPILLPRYISELYEKSLFLYEDESFYSARTYLNLFKNIFDQLSPDESVLEIGCGNGIFLQELNRIGWRKLVGIEPSKEAVSKAPDEIKAFIRNSSFENSDLPENFFDIIAHFHLLDHLIDPSEFLNKCWHLLKQNGFMLLVCHNEKALSALILRELSPIYDIEHIYLFNKNTLKKILKKTGFSVVWIGSMINPYPIGYWIRLIPYLNRLGSYIPERLGKFPVPLPAGNIYALAQKKF